MIKAVVFDIGGVLYPEDALRDAYDGIVRKFRLDKEEFRRVRDKYIDAASQGKFSAAEHLRIIGRELGISPVALRQEWRRLYLKHITLDKGVDAIVRKLKGRYRLATLTNITTLHHGFRKEKGLFYRHFPIIVASCDEGSRKPQVTLYRRLLARLWLPPEEVVFIDDKEQYLAPARRLGMKTILFKDARQLKRDLAKLGVEA